MVGTRFSREALTLATEFHPELAVVDIRMPDLDGFELMAQLKARFPGIDVILMTGSIDDLDEKLVRAIQQCRVLFHPEAVRSRSAQNAGLPLRRAAAATGRSSAAAEAARKRDGRGARVPGELAA